MVADGPHVGGQDVSGRGSSHGGRGVEVAVVRAEPDGHAGDSEAEDGQGRAQDPSWRRQAGRGRGRGPGRGRGRRGSGEGGARCRCKAMPGPPCRRRRRHDASRGADSPSRPHSPSLRRPEETEPVLRDASPVAAARGRRRAGPADDTTAHRPAALLFLFLCCFVSLLRYGNTARAGLALCSIESLGAARVSRQRCQSNPGSASRSFEAPVALTSHGSYRFCGTCTVGQTGRQTGRHAASYVHGMLLRCSIRIVTLLIANSWLHCLHWHTTGNKRQLQHGLHQRPIVPRPMSDPNAICPTRVAHHSSLAPSSTSSSRALVGSPPGTQSPKRQK